MEKTVLVTGGAGYIGSHCVLTLLRCGYKVVICDNLSTGFIETIDVLKKLGDVKFYNIDLLNYIDIDMVFKENNIDAVIHLAAFSQVAESMINPQKYYENNVCGSVNLFKAMLDNSINKVVFSSSAAVYGKPDYVPIDEKHPQNPVNPYGQSKLIVEKILNDYDKTYGIRSVQLRYFNVVGADSEGRIGEKHNPETHLIPKILQSTFTGGAVFEIYGTDYQTKDGTCIRDYINVEDLADAHVSAIRYLIEDKPTVALNLGTNGGNSVKEVLDICKAITQKEIPVKISPRRSGDPEILIADNKKARDILGWIPSRDLHKSIESAFNWEKSLQNKS